MFDLLELQSLLLSEAWPAGFEKREAALIASLAEPFVDDIWQDNLGNLICHKRGKGPRVVFPAHMDVLGLIITKINSDGTAFFDTIGGFSAIDLTSAPFRLENGLAVSVGIRVEAESTSKSLGDLSDKEDLYLDIGARNETDAKKYLEPGMVARYDSKPIRLGNDQIVTPYADNLMSCCALLSAMEQVSNQSSPNDLYFLFTAQEEVGLRGARAAAFKLRPDYCIVLDGTHTADCPSDTRKYGSKLGGGAALKISDSSFISNRQVTDHLRRIALAENILWQDDIMQGGGTDGQAFQSAPGGVLTSGISIPMRNIHSPYETVSEADVKAVAKLISIVALSDFSSVK